MTVNPEALVAEVASRMSDGQVKGTKAIGRLHGFEVTYTPGHASHHVSYFDPSSGLAFVGDVAGVCALGGYVLPPTPPPDIDLEAWRESCNRIRAWQPSALVLSHFGVFGDAAAHLDEHDAALADWAEGVRVSLDEPGSDDERASRFATERLAALKAVSTDDGASRVHFSQIRDCWFGLARYWRKRSARVEH